MDETRDQTVGQGCDGGPIRWACKNESMWTETSGVIGIGYEGKDISAFLEELRTWKISTVVDVRLNPISRKKGFSKKALAEALSEAGLQYRHLSALGNPKDNRDGFREPGTTASKAAGDRYKELLERNESAQAIEELMHLAAGQRIAVMCFEASERCCHRHYVLEKVKKRLDDLVPA